jgi:hypothetical protein
LNSSPVNFFDLLLGDGPTNTLGLVSIVPDDSAGKPDGVELSSSFLFAFGVAGEEVG